MSHRYWGSASRKSKIDIKPILIPYFFGLTLTCASDLQTQRLNIQQASLLSTWKQYFTDKLAKSKLSSNGRYRREHFYHTFYHTSIPLDVSSQSNGFRKSHKSASQMVKMWNGDESASASSLTNIIHESDKTTVRNRPVGIDSSSTTWNKFYDADARSRYRHWLLCKSSRIRFFSSVTPDPMISHNSYTDVYFKIGEEKNSYALKRLRGNLLIVEINDLGQAEQYARLVMSE